MIDFQLGIQDIHIHQHDRMFFIISFTSIILMFLSIKFSVNEVPTILTKIAPENFTYEFINWTKKQYEDEFYLDDNEEIAMINKTEINTRESNKFKVAMFFSCNCVKLVGLLNLIIIYMILNNYAKIFFRNNCSLLNHTKIIIFIIKIITIVLFLLITVFYDFLTMIFNKEKTEKICRNILEYFFFEIGIWGILIIILLIFGLFIVSIWQRTSLINLSILINCGIIIFMMIVTRIFAPASNSNQYEIVYTRHTKWYEFTFGLQRNCFTVVESGFISVYPIDSYVFIESIVYNNVGIKRYKKPTIFLFMLIILIIFYIVHNRYLSFPFKG